MEAGANSKMLTITSDSKVSPANEVMQELRGQGESVLVVGSRGRTSLNGRNTLAKGAA